VLISEGLATQKSQGDVHVHNFSSRAGRSYRMNHIHCAEIRGRQTQKDYLLTNQEKGGKSEASPTEIETKGRRG
jgi:hypothetical protein